MGRRLGTALLVLAAVAPSPGGAQVPDADVYVASLARTAGGLRIGEPANITARAGYDNQPHFTRDGAAVLYTRIEADGRADIWRYELATGTARAVTRTPESEYSATPLAGGGFAVVRVEADSTQRLWRFDEAGGSAALLFPAVQPVGYQAWLDDSTAALFVLGSPAALHVARLGEAGSVRLAEGIGRALQPVPGRRAVSFVQQRSDGTWLMQYEPAAAEPVRALARVPVDSAARTAAGESRPVAGEYHAWLPDGTLLATAGASVFALAPGSGRWQVVADYRERGWRLSRIALDPRGERIALVVESH